MNILHSYRLTATAAMLLLSTGVFAQGAKDPSLPKPSDGVKEGWQKSLTNDGAWDRTSSHLVAPIPWQRIREDDILWKKRVWREIDTREKQNVAFRYVGDENTGGGMFIEILIDAVKKGKITAYDAFDDRFTQVMTKEKIMEKVSGSTTIEEVEDPVTGETRKVERHKDFRPETITKYRIKEDWIFDRNLGQMVVRIVGLAPVQDIYGDDGVFRGQQAMFWLYYPDIRGVLAQYEVYNPENDISRPTWDEYFENRQFASRVTKVSNPFGEDFKEHLNPMETLYESQRTMEMIFNKEHDMWEY
jgi:gliding motility associated protien GldN